MRLAALRHGRRLVIGRLALSHLVRRRGFRQFQTIEEAALPRIGRRLLGRGLGGLADRCRRRARLACLRAASTGRQAAEQVGRLLVLRLAGGVRLPCPGLLVIDAHGV
ncbi:hypothetical protein, partial [Burkholderia sp. Ap-962]|uniref:hypothetical protein n=1 Tax=Burkholderia sp. Ap-962 TaxID=2608333 RepID=UPI0019662D38